jgi:hypothetical protein
MIMEMPCHRTIYITGVQLYITFKLWWDKLRFLLKHSKISLLAIATNYDSCWYSDIDIEFDPGWKTRGQDWTTLFEKEGIADGNLISFKR